MYIFLLLSLCILIVCLCMATLTEVFPCFFLSCKANVRVKPVKTGHGPHSSKFLYFSMRVIFINFPKHYGYCLCMTTLTEVFPCFFLSCKANARVNPAKMGHAPHSSQLLCCSMYFLCCSMYFCVLCIVCFMTLPVLFVCTCVLNNCHRVATQLQLTL